MNQEPHLTCRESSRPFEEESLTTVDGELLRSDRPVELTIPAVTRTNIIHRYEEKMQERVWGERKD